MNQKPHAPSKQIQKRIMEEVFQRQENEAIHNPYEQELRELYSIEQGDEETLAQSISETYEGDFGVLAKDPLRSHKNLVIGNITMASRAAIRGGLSVEEAFTVADSLIQQLEEIDNIPDVSAFKQQAQYLYVRLVAAAREAAKKAGAKGKEKEPRPFQNPLVARTKDYIFTHLHDSIQVAQIASHLQVNPDYLSHLFHRQEKGTVSHYIPREKIKRGENLLKYSDYRIQDIAFYLGFCTQSHFAKVFQQFVGMSPKEYRKMYGISHDSN